MPNTDPVGSICVVANELTHLFRNGGIGTHNWLLADALADAGWKVHILYCAEIEDAAQLVRCRQMLNAKGITLWHLDEFASPAEDKVHCGLSGWVDIQSMRVRRALAQLDAFQHFDLIEFAEWTGYGFRTIQARQMGLAFADARIIVKLHSSSQWCREGNREWQTSSDDLTRDYFERYSFERADIQLSPSAYMLEYAASIGWNVRDEAQVIPYCYPATSADVSKWESPTPELVFFGRLEPRKGLKLFLEAVKSLPREVAISFMGKETPIDGVPAGQLIGRMLGGRKYTLHSNFDRDQAMAYLKSGHRIAIMPSLIENYPFTVLECAASGAAFLASNVGGIPEIVADRRLREAILFEPNAKSFRRTLDAYLATNPTTRLGYVEKMHEITNSKRNHAAVCQSYAELLPQSAGCLAEDGPRLLPAADLDRRFAAAVKSRPLVSLVVPYYNMGDFLPETLASLAAQDYRNTEVIVVNDGSTDPHALDVWRQMQADYPRFHFITQDNQGLGGARNAGLAVAQGEYFLPVDSDNVARPEMVSRLVDAFERNPQLAVATCFFLAFEETDDITDGRHQYAYRPCGGPFVAAALRNVYGDANGMIRTEALRSVGGYETDKDTTCEDWEVYVKLFREGYRLDVVPEYLFYYRHRSASLIRTTDSILNRRRVLRQFFTVGDLPKAEQIELWTALASLDERHKERWSLEHELNVTRANFDKERRYLQGQLAKANRFGSDVRRAVRGVKSVLKKAPYYEVVSARLKRYRKREKRAA